MANWKEGDRVRVVTRETTEEDRKANRYFPHMAGVTGTVQNLYGEDQIAIKADVDTLPKTSATVHTASIKRMREKFAANVSDEQKKQLSSEELNFDANFVLLVRSVDLEKI